MKIQIKLKNVLIEKGISQKELAKKTGIRECTISEICRNSKTVMNFEHMEKIAEALEITDITELIEMK